MPPSATVPFVVEPEISAMFGSVESLLKRNSQLLRQLDNALEVSDLMF